MGARRRLVAGLYGAVSVFADLNGAADRRCVRKFWGRSRSPAIADHRRDEKPGIRSTIYGSTRSLVSPEGACSRARPRIPGSDIVHGDAAENRRTTEVALEGDKVFLPGMVTMAGANRIRATGGCSGIFIGTHVDRHAGRHEARWNKFPLGAANAPDRRRPRFIAAATNLFPINIPSEGLESTRHCRAGFFGHTGLVALLFHSWREMWLAGGYHIRQTAGRPAGGR